MPSLKPVIRKGIVNADGKASIKIRIVHDGKVSYLKTPWYIEPRYMGINGQIRSSYPGATALNGALLLLLQQYNNIIANVGPDVVYMDHDSLVTKLKNNDTTNGSFTEYTKKRITDLTKEGRFSLAVLYEATLSHLEKFKGESILFKEITFSFLKDFENHLRIVAKLKTNSIRNYLCNIRAIFNHAIDAEVIKQDLFPFRKYRILQESTAKRSLSIEDLYKLRQTYSKLSLAKKKALDTFFLIFYLVGINFKDLIFLKHDDIYKGRILYRRFKTGRNYSIKLFPPANEIIKLYAGEKYVLNFMEKKEAVTGSRTTDPYKDLVKNTNKHLKEISKTANLEVKLSTYFARHSWATIAAGLGIQRDVIAYALGHNTNTITDIYIDFDLSKVDKANDKVIKALERYTPPKKRKPKQ